MEGKKMHEVALFMFHAVLAGGAVYLLRAVVIMAAYIHRSNKEVQR